VENPKITADTAKMRYARERRSGAVSLKSNPARMLSRTSRERSHRRLTASGGWSLPPIKQTRFRAPAFPVRTRRAREQLRHYDLKSKQKRHFGHPTRGYLREAVLKAAALIFGEGEEEEEKGRRVA
jgi:hypothetical protein